MSLTYEALSEGDALPEVERAPTRAMVEVGLGGDPTAAPRQFWDEEYALGIGLPGTIVPGNVQFVVLEQYLNRWLDGAGSVRKLQLSLRRPNQVGVPMLLGGNVVRLYEDGQRGLADVEFHIDTPEGERAVRASATVEF